MSEQILKYKMPYLGILEIIKDKSSTGDKYYAALLTGHFEDDFRIITDDCSSKEAALEKATKELFSEAKIKRERALQESAGLSLLMARLTAEPINLECYKQNIQTPEVNPKPSEGN